jgi:hypothetical protein
MMSGIFCTVFLSLLSLGHGFPQPSHSILRKQGWALPISLIATMQDESSYRFLMVRARECAFSDNSSAEEARGYLTEILHIQEGCISGLLTGHDLCDNVDEVAEVVSQLRDKIETGAVAIK